MIPGSLRGPLIVHAPARLQAADIEASIEKFLDDALLTDFRETPLNTIDSVLESRRERREQLDRVHERTQELLREEQAKKRHAMELRELEDAINVTKQPEGGRPPSHAQKEREKGGEGASAAAPSSDLAADSTTGAATLDLPFKLEGSGRSKKLNPYVANFSEFVAEGLATRNARDLRSENELLRKCLSDPRNPKAFDSYIRAAKGNSL